MAELEKKESDERNKRIREKENNIENEPPTKKVREQEAMFEALLCPICGEVFDNPISLGCNHTFCYNCIVRDIASRPYNHTNGCVQCAQCRELTDIQRRPLANRVNYALLDVANQRRKFLGLSESTTLCRQPCLYDDDDLAARMKEMEAKQAQLEQIQSTINHMRGTAKLAEEDRDLKRKEYIQVCRQIQLSRNKIASLRLVERWEEWVVKGLCSITHRLSGVQEMVFRRREFAISECAFCWVHPIIITRCPKDEWNVKINYKPPGVGQSELLQKNINQKLQNYFETSFKFDEDIQTTIHTVAKLKHFISWICKQPTGIKGEDDNLLWFRPYSVKVEQDMSDAGTQTKEADFIQTDEDMVGIACGIVD